jgi:signal transduction histidine kinase
MQEDWATGQRLSTTVVLALAAVCGALVAIFGDKYHVSSITVAAALVGLVPWALIAGGVRMPPLLFVGLTVAAVAAMILWDRNAGGAFPMMLVVVAITRSAPKPIVGLTVALAVSMTIGLAVLEGSTQRTGAIYFVGGIGVAWLAGALLRRQEALVTELQAAQARQSVHAATVERTRIAREIHDVVAHSLTVTMLHVTGARRALAQDPERASEALERAETVGRESLDTIRQIVGLLRSDDRHLDDDAPLPMLSDIPSLIDQYRTAGLRVEADLQLDEVAADPPTALVAFRVVQEALSNVLQHSPGSAVDLSVAREPDGSALRIIVVNQTSGPANKSDRVGLGVRGMTERVRALGGSIEAGATATQSWRVDAELPLRRVAAT